MDLIDTAELLATTRTRCGKTQQYMSRKMGKSLSTVQNWESGASSPRLQDVWSWFNRLGINPIRALLEYLHPNIYGIPFLDMKNTDRALRHYIENVASERERLELAYCLLCGSSWSAQLDLLTTINQLPAKDRILVMSIIIQAYDMEMETGGIAAPDLQPDLENIRNEIDRLINTIKG